MFCIINDWDAIHAVDSGTRGTLREAPQLLYSAAPDGIGEERLLSAVMPLDLSAKAGNAFLEGFLQGTAQAVRSLGKLRPLVVEQIEPCLL